MKIMVSLLMIFTGLGITVIWTKDILTSDEIDRSGGLLQCRNKENGELMMLHWIAEYITAGGLVVCGFGNLFLSFWTGSLSLIFLGALAYTSLNSLSWSLAVRERRAYTFPMIFGLLVSLIGILYFL